MLCGLMAALLVKCSFFFKECLFRFVTQISGCAFFLADILVLYFVVYFVWQQLFCRMQFSVCSFVYAELLMVVYYHFGY